MGTLGVVLLVAFVIVCILLVLLVLIQDSGENGMGGLLGGRSTAAFGSHSASVLSKATFVLVILFFVLVLGLALVNKKPKVLDLDEGTAVETPVEESATDTNGNWWDSEKEAESTEAAVIESAENELQETVNSSEETAKVEETAAVNEPAEVKVEAEKAE